LPPDARYLGIDVSATMVGLTRKRLARFGARAEVLLSDGAARLDFPDGSFDRFVSTYVLDILSSSDVSAVLDEAHRVLVPGGRVGLISLTRGKRGFPRLLTSAWDRLWALSPGLVGGCRPINLTPYLENPKWTLDHDEIVTSFGVPSQVVIASRSRS
jgi:SAM-dependent methyltransferase